MGRQSKPRNLVVVMSYKLNVLMLNVKTKTATTTNKPACVCVLWKRKYQYLFSLLLFWFLALCIIISYAWVLEGVLRTGNIFDKYWHVGGFIYIFIFPNLPSSVCSRTDQMLTPNQLRSANIFVWIGTRIVIELGICAARRVDGGVGG